MENQSTYIEQGGADAGLVKAIGVHYKGPQPSETEWKNLK